MTSDLVAYVGPPSAAEYELIERMATQIQRAGILPVAYRGKPGDIIAAALYGREVGLGPMAALQRIVVINGKPTLDAQGMVTVVRRAGHSITGQSTPVKASVTGKRADTGDEMSVEFTIEQAKAAGLVKKGPWTDYPDDMLWARAVTKLCRRLFADVLAGFSYTTEEAEAFTPEPAKPRTVPTVQHGSKVIDAETGELIEDTDDVPVPVEAEVVEVHRPVQEVPLPVEDTADGKRGLTQAGNIEFHALLKDMDCTEEIYRAAMEAIYKEKARGVEKDGTVKYSVKHLPRQDAARLLGALKNEDKAKEFMLRGIDWLAEPQPRDAA